MRSFRLAVLFLTISSWGALAADNAVIVTPGSGVTMRSKDIGAGVQSMMPIPGDVVGNPLATAPGSGNASYALPMQGVVGGVAIPISGTITANAGTNLNTSALALESGGNLATIAGAITSSVMQVNLKQLNGAALGSPSNYGTSPGAVEVQGVNAYVTNSVAVTGTFYQATQPVSIASAQVASGAFASGSLAAGSMVDLLTMRGSASGGTAAADSILAGGVYNSSAPTLTNGQQASFQFTSAGSLHTTVDNTNANGSAVSASSSHRRHRERPGRSRRKSRERRFRFWLDCLRRDGRSLDRHWHQGGGHGSGQLVARRRRLQLHAPSPTNGQQTAVQGDNQGRAITAPGSILSHTLVKGTTAAMTGTTSTQLIALVSSQRIYPTHISCNNSSSTATLVSIQDGSAGTTLMTLIAPAGGGDTESDIDALTWTTAGNGLYAADVTTGASVICSASGHSSAN